MAEEIQVRHEQVRRRDAAQDCGRSLARRGPFPRLLLLAVDFRSGEGGARTRVRIGATKAADGAAGLNMTILVLCWESNLCNTLGFYAQAFRRRGVRLVCAGPEFLWNGNVGEWLRLCPEKPALI